MSRRTFIRRASGFGAVALLSDCGAPALQPSPSTKIYRIGWLGQTAGPIDLATVYPGLRRDLSDLGYVEGRNLSIEFRIAVGTPDRLPEMASELVNLSVDVIIATTSNPALAAKQATGTIPIVFTALADPVGLGIVPSLTEHGSNVTGVTNPGIELEAKRLELLKETVPRLASIVVLFNGTDGGQKRRVQAARDAARALGVGTVEPIPTNTLGDLDEALRTVARQSPDGLVDINPSSLYGQDLANLGRLLDFVVEHRLPHMCFGPDAARAGGLMGLAADAEAGQRRAARVIDKILRGAKPADIPVEVNTDLVLTLNVAMARRIGLTFPESVLRQATEVIK